MNEGMRFAGNGASEVGVVRGLEHEVSLEDDQRLLDNGLEL